jgi:hypothetical protein
MECVAKLFTAQACDFIASFSTMIYNKSSSTNPPCILNAYINIPKVMKTIWDFICSVKDFQKIHQSLGSFILKPANYMPQNLLFT